MLAACQKAFLSSFRHIQLYRSQRLIQGGGCQGSEAFDLLMKIDLFGLFGQKKRMSCSTSYRPAARLAKIESYPPKREHSADLYS